MGGEFHLYAGMNSFMRFDLTTQRPFIFTPMETCKNLFYERASIEQNDWIFAADNTLTREFFFVTPSPGPRHPLLDKGEDCALCFDYQYGKARTTSLQMTAAASIKRVEPAVIEGTDWFLMASPANVLLLYGLSAENVSAWGAKEIFYRRGDNPFNEQRKGYDCVLQTGYYSFGNEHSEKLITGYTLTLASTSVRDQVRVEIMAATNPNQPGDAHAVDTFVLPDAHIDQNHVPLHFVSHHFAERLTVPAEFYRARAGRIEFSQRTWEFLYLTPSSKDEGSRMRSGSTARA
jgi:hypothetical protein